MVLQQIINDPVMLSVAVGGLALALGFILYKEFIADSKDTIESEGLEDKYNKIFNEAVSSQGAKVSDYVKHRSTSSTSRLVGMAYRVKKLDVIVRVWDNENNEFKSEKNKGYVYSIIEGSSKPLLAIKKFITDLGFKIFLTTYDVPEWLLNIGDDYIWFTEKAHFVKYNGVKRHLSERGLSRATESAFSKIHENYIGAVGDIPEQYSVLNKQISGQLRIENEKSHNFRQFEKLKKNLDKIDAMDS